MLLLGSERSSKCYPLAANFIIALTLLPLLVLLILWVTLGFNLFGLPLGLSPLGFHISHGAVFALMFFYWKYLDMFQTIRYLALVSIPLFLFGHRLLATLAARR
ncbi:unnamed protein product, partial [Adineta steineri]